MGVVIAGDVEAGTAQLGLELGRAVDPHVPADRLRCVVLVAQPPVDLLRPLARHRRGERPARLEHAVQLGQRLDVGLDVLEHLAGDHPVERRVGERQAGGVAAQDADEARRVDLRRRRSSRRTSPVCRPPRRRRSPGRRRRRRRGRGRTHGVRSRPRRPARGHPGARRAGRSGSSASAAYRQSAVALQLLDVGRHGQHLAVLVDGQLGAVPPAPPLDDPGAPGQPDAGAQFRIVEATAQGGGQGGGGRAGRRGRGGLRGADGGVATESARLRGRGAGRHATGWVAGCGRRNSSRVIGGR